jgi:hypothetical protein
MKSIYGLIAILISGISLKGQSLANYGNIRNTGITYTSIASTGTSFNSWRNIGAFSQDDNRSDFTNIGFDFWYNGLRYTQFCVSSNGFIDFSASTDDGGGQPDDFGFDNNAFTNSNLANSTNPAIAPFYDDLTAQGGVNALGNSIKYQLSGSAPNRTLTIEWINMAVYQNTSPSLNFQVKLVETSGVVIIHYGTMNAGTNTFSYSMGLNGPVLSAAPTAAQLKILQTVNANTFNNTVQNNLSVMPTANSQYIFTPPVPTATSGALSFSGVSQTSMTLNWSNWATNEVGYVIYNSTDGINYSFVSQTAANAVNASVTGLLSSTTYFWRLYAATEGGINANPIQGTQATLVGANKISNNSGNWSNAAIWTPVGVPNTGDNVTIADGHLVTLDINGGCNSLTIGQGVSGTLRFDGTAKTFTVNSNIVLTPAASFSVNTTSNVTHTLLCKGNISNAGRINFASDANSLVNTNFTKNGNQTITGSGTFSFNIISVNMGTSQNNILEVSSSNFSAPTNFLSLTNGTFKLSTSGSVNLTPFSSANTVAATCGLWLNSSTATLTAIGGIALYGQVTVSSGTFNIGNAIDQDLLLSGGSLVMSGGALNIAAKCYGTGINNLCDINISGGIITVPSFSSTNTTNAPFQITGVGSTFNMSGGTILIPRSGGSGAQNLGFLNTGTNSGAITGGTLQLGSIASPASQTIDINTIYPVGNLVVTSSNVSARLNTNTLSVINSISINSGTLNANNLNISLGGNWTNAATYLPGTGITTFSSNSAQSILKTGGETFNILSFSGSGVKTFSSAITANSNFSINTGASVDVSSSNHTLTVRGNFVNNGSFTSRAGLVLLNGTSNQTIGGSSVTSFYDLTLNNTTGATLGTAQNLLGTLSLNNGIFSVNSQSFTMVSTATATARIAQITGSGDITGNVTIQRFIPGGSTGWALLGSPLSSALTLQDWDDDIVISCPTCPDGFVSGFPSVYTYDETVSGAYDSFSSYVPLNTISDPLVQGKGYWVYVGSGLVTTTNLSLDLTGTVRKFNYTIPLNYTNFGSSANDGWNLIHNPYPSPISWNSLRGATANLDNAIYVYNADLNGGTGGNATFINGISSPAVGSGGIDDNIAMGQAFYIHSTGATALNATEANKVTGNPVFLKSSSSSNNVQSLLRIRMTGMNGFDDECVLYQQTGTGIGFDDSFDAYKLSGQDPNAPTIALESGTTLFQVNGVAPISGNFSINLKAHTGYSGSYTISASNYTSFPKGACISLFDKFTSITTDLKTTDYIFNLLDTTTVARFVLNITLNPLQVLSNITQPSCQDSLGNITIKGANVGPWNYHWKDQNGTTIRTSINKSSEDTLQNISSGVFFVEINTVGMCDNNSSNFTFVPVQLSIAQFSSADTVMVSQGGAISFNNNSANSSQSVWDFGDNTSLSYVNSPTHIYTTPGIYSVSLISTSNSGCLDTASKFVTLIDDYVGLISYNGFGKEFVVKTLSDNIYLLENNSNIRDLVEVKLIDPLGKLILDYGVIDQQNMKLKVNLNNYNRGVYFLTLTGNGSKKTLKLPVN